jgi:hypothetical protein
MNNPLQSKTISAAVLLGTLLAGCVTINIYFPASAAEKAADTIIDEVWQIKGKPAAAANVPSAPSSPSAPDAPKEKTP